MRVAFLTFCLILSGCASQPYDGERLADLDANLVEEELDFGAIDEVSTTDTIDSYRALTAFPVSNPFRVSAMHRLADLLLEYVEDRDEVVNGDSDYKDLSELGEAIHTYEAILNTYPDYPQLDQVMYQLSRAYDMQGDIDKPYQLLFQLVNEYPRSIYVEEAYFRLGEYYFLLGDYQQALMAYGSILNVGKSSQYYEYSLLKYSWSHYKVEQNDQALESFFDLLDLKLEQVHFDQLSLLPESLSKADLEIINDTLRGMNLVFLLNNNLDQLPGYINSQQRRQYSHFIYKNIADLYQSEKRYLEAAAVYSDYLAIYSDMDAAPIFQIALVDQFSYAGKVDRIVTEKENFVRQYWLDQAREQKYQEKLHPYLQSIAATYSEELATYYHARYQKQSLDADYQEAVSWYRNYLENFPEQDNSHDMHFFLAELLFDKNDYLTSAHEYEQIAYFSRLNKHAEEAAYAAILSLKKATDAVASAEINQLKLNSSLRFVSLFPESKYTPAVLLENANERYAAKDLDDARLFAGFLVDNPAVTPEDEVSAQLLLGHIHFQQGDYLKAEMAYQTVYTAAVSARSKVAEAEEWLAVSIYKQAEYSASIGDDSKAIEDYLRISKLAPKSEIRAQADFDAVALLIKQEQWQQAGALLEAFQSSYPGHSLQSDVPVKLAYVYTKLGRSADAAYAYEQIATQTDDAETGQAALLTAADLYQGVDQSAKAIATYKRYLKRYPDVTLTTFTIKSQLADIYDQQARFSKRDYWLNDIIKNAKNKAFSDETDVQYLAAKSSFTLAEEKFNEFEEIPLVEPIRENLVKKKQKMESALAAYRLSSDYGYAEFVSASTHRIGEIYVDLSAALLDSERPDNLDGEELEQYELMLEEQAYPFEETAIDVLKSNIAHIKDGIYNSWIDKSILELARLLPMQYARQELQSEVIDALH